ncbi:MAG: acetyl-CoA carboxylase biotin carboxyl carrier protein [Candidatus Omnitrophica bacterium]|nr:acetyl-CoA carboxylase biotin carboxyl carrier protein [Candidatus Omnitrophota bacterium]MBU4148922.1 acetyl-CoA carboxylase biotin carboxyl carrier protein [Candidatus Omnitrophota bacterium]
MNLKEIKELINLMNENDLLELEIEREGTKIRIKKSSSGKFETISEEPGARRVIENIRPDVAPGTAKTEAVPDKNLIAINAPMVGTFYRTASPEAKPYVEIGQQVEVGQIVCIIEAMKLMNEIKSEVKGKVVEVIAENATPVEYGQALFMVETA